jgi:hypothetical protein
MCSCLEHVGHGGDAGRPSFDGGFFGGSATGAAIEACLGDLETCAQGSTDPRTCAEDAVTCIKTALGIPDDAGFSSRPHPSFDGGGFPFPSFDAGSFSGPTGHGSDDAGFPAKGGGKGGSGRDFDASWP